MVRKLGFAFGLVLVAAISPAPINSGVKPPMTPEQSQEKLAQQQAMNGAVPVVGAVPEVQRPGGLAVTIERAESKDTGDPGSAAAITRGSLRADQVGNNARGYEVKQSIHDANHLAIASERVVTESRNRMLMPMFVAVMFFVGYLIFQVFKRWIDKQVPVPKKVLKMQAK